MVTAELVRGIRDMLSDNAGFEAAEIVMHVLGVDRNALILNSRDDVSDIDAEKARQLAERRRRGEPLQYIIGAAEFMSLGFSVDESVLIPRSDTETLVEYVLEKIKGRHVRLIDIGTGSGCIGISIAKYHGDVDLTLADISDAALRIAAENAENNGVKAKILKIDIMSEVPDGKYGAVVSNPPYIRSGVIPTLQTEVKDHEPLTALDGGADGLRFYRRITDIAPRFLDTDGLLAYEIGFDQGRDVSELMQKDFSGVEIVKDLCGNDRVVAGRLK